MSDHGINATATYYYVSISCGIFYSPFLRLTGSDYLSHSYEPGYLSNIYVSIYFFCKKEIAFFIFYEQQKIALFVNCYRYVVFIF